MLALLNYFTVIYLVNSNWTMTQSLHNMCLSTIQAMHPYQTYQKKGLQYKGFSKDKWWDGKKGGDASQADGRTNCLQGSLHSLCERTKNSEYTYWHISTDRLTSRTGRTNCSQLGRDSRMSWVSHFDRSWFEPWSNRVNNIKINTCHFLTRHLALLGWGGDWVIQCQDNTNESDIGVMVLVVWFPSRAAL